MTIGRDRTDAKSAISNRNTLLVGVTGAGAALGGIAFLTRPSLSLFETNALSGFAFVALTESWAAIVWLIAALGFGRAIERGLVKAAPLWRTPVEWSLGVAFLLWLDHLLGAAGVLTTRYGATAWVIDAVGVTLLLLVRGRDDEDAGPSDADGLPLTWLAAAPGIAVLLVAASSAPGWLWLSEAHGYDTLSYHLQLPKEWLELGRIEPLEHNVYSFLPSYVEAAYLHLGVQFEPWRGSYLNGVVRGALACQWWHALITLVAAWSLHRVVYGLTRDARLGGAAGALFLCTPWVIVTGSMAYNESAVALMLIGGLAMLWSRESLRPRDLFAIGVLAGAACGAKLTSVAFVAAPIGVLAVLRASRGHRLGGTIAGLLAGAIMLAPYLIRNAIHAGGNPLFPFVAEWFGSAHWSDEQVERWNRAHAPDRSWLSRPARFVEVALIHGQWAGLWILGAAGVAVAGVLRRRRAVIETAVLLVIIVVVWSAGTHLQSRFLLPAAPLLVIGAIFGLEAWPGERRRSSQHLAPAIAVAGAFMLGLWSVALFHRERGGAPASYVDGLALMSGELFAGARSIESATALQTHPFAFVNHRLPEDAGGLYLLGDATAFYLARPILYHTTWDRAPLGEAIRTTQSDDPRAWSRELKSRGVEFILINFAELARLIETDDWYDPEVTRERVAALAIEAGEPLGAWPIDAEDPARLLIRLK
ncbi:MAG: hypothetical protein ACF8PN_00165 [Phycisphaerales bacterium]